MTELTANKIKVIQRPRAYQWLGLILIIIILLSPLLYWSTGIGQAAANLSAEVTRQPDGTLVSSPKAEALHSLSLPIRVERLIIYPLLLLCFQLSGGALALRRRLEAWVQAAASPFSRVKLSRSMPNGLGWLGRFIPRAWRQRLTWRELLVIFLFIILFNLALALLYLPFNFYRGFIMAHQFGLSTQTTLGWAGDWLKTLLLGLIIDGLTWTGFYGLVRLLPRQWPVLGGGLLMLFSFVFVLLDPILITPLFYEVHPLADPDLRTRILALTDRAGMHVDTVEIINASAKTTQVNAYFTGFGGARRIVLYDTLLAGYTPDEVEAVLAHEMGHWYHQHMLWATLGLGAVGWLGLFGLRWLLERTWRLLGLHGPADVAGLPYLLAVIAIATILSLPAQMAISRLAERQADHFALAVSQNPVAIAELFEKFAVQNLSVVDAPAWEKILFYTHPPLAERIHTAETFQGQK